MFISKRILIIVGVAGVLVIGALGFAFAFLLSQANASSSNNAATTPTPVVATATPSPSAANRACASGVVQSRDSQHQAFVVSENKGSKTVTVTTNAQTVFHKRGDTTFAFAGLTVGQRVRVTSQGACDRTTTAFVARAITVIVSSATPTPAASPTTTPTP